MKKLNKDIVRKICLLTGAFMVVVAIVLLLTFHINVYTSIEKSSRYVETIQNLIPETRGATPEERRENDLPSLSVDTESFVGILEMPRYQSTLPVGATFGKTTKFPCLFSGSVYDKTIKIGATTQKGQFDFYREISLGDSVYFTDMEGNRYAYSITNIRYEKHATKDVLEENESDLTLFVKNIYDYEYLIIDCNTAK